MAPRHVFYPAAFLEEHGLLDVLNGVLLEYDLELRCPDDGVGQLELVQHDPATTPAPRDDYHAVSARSDYRRACQAEALTALASRHPEVLAIHRVSNGECVLVCATGSNLGALLSAFGARHLSVHEACHVGAQRREWAGPVVYRREPADE